MSIINKLLSLIGKPSRIKTFFVGLLLSVLYGFLAMLFLWMMEAAVSVTFIFTVPLVLGAIPVLYSTKEQLRTYTIFLALPFISVLTLCLLCFTARFEGMLCLVIIVGPFIIIGSLGAFIFRMAKLSNEGPATPLYSVLLLPLLFVMLEQWFQPTDKFYTVTTTMDVNAERATVWQHIKNVQHIQRDEIQPHFIHGIGIPRPLNGELDREGVGATRSITWEKGIKFREVINQWEEGKGFAYDIEVDPGSIPPSTLDEHVMIGGKYFDVVSGSYHIDSVAAHQQRVTLTCRYRVTTNLNFYSRWWADYILDDFNEMILEVIKHRCEKTAI